jgi:hypothetical protein
MKSATRGPDLRRPDGGFTLIRTPKNVRSTDPRPPITEVHTLRWPS